MQLESRGFYKFVAISVVSNVQGCMKQLKVFVLKITFWHPFPKCLFSVDKSFWTGCSNFT